MRHGPTVSGSASVPGFGLRLHVCARRGLGGVGGLVIDVGTHIRRRLSLLKHLQNLRLL